MVQELGKQLVCMDRGMMPRGSNRTYWGRYTARQVNNVLALCNNKMASYLCFPTPTPIAATVDAMRVGCASGGGRRSWPSNLSHDARRTAGGRCRRCGRSKESSSGNAAIFAALALARGSDLHRRIERTIGWLISSCGLARGSGRAS